MFGLEFPEIFGFYGWEIALPNVQHRQQGQSNHAPTWVLDEHRETDPVVTIEPLATDGTGRGIVMNVCPFHFPSVSLGWTVIQGERPVAIGAWIETFENDCQYGQRQRCRGLTYGT